MKLEEQVTSLELSKKLLTLGVKQNSLFYWAKFNDDFNIIQRMKIDGCTVILATDEKYSAYTASELLELLPNNHANFYKTEMGYIFSISGEPNTIDNNFANCCAKMLVYLIENQLIEV